MPVCAEVRDASLRETSESRPGPGRLRRVAPLLVLLVEVGVLTPFVEFSSGPIAHVASARVCAALLFALVAFLLLTGRQVRAREPSRSRRVLPWLAAHLGGYAAFVLWTLLLARSPSSVVPWLGASVWVLLGLAVAVTCCLTFLSWRLVAAWGWGCRGQLLASLSLGVALYAVTPWVQGLWPAIHGPALALDGELLRWTYGESITGLSPRGWPVLGTRRLLLRVTPQCSEVEAIVAFWMLAGALTFAHRREVRWLRVVMVLGLGTGLLYLLMAVRLYGLVVLGTQLGPRAAVDLAHSRLGGILFLGVSVALVVVMSRWCRVSTVLDEPQSSRPVTEAG